MCIVLRACLCVLRLTCADARASICVSVSFVWVCLGGWVCVGTPLGVCMGVCFAVCESAHEEMYVLPCVLVCVSCEHMLVCELCVCVPWGMCLGRCTYVHEPRRQTLRKEMNVSPTPAQLTGFLPPTHLRSIDRRDFETNLSQWRWPPLFSHLLIQSCTA